MRNFVSNRQFANSPGKLLPGQSFKVLTDGTPEIHVRIGHRNLLIAEDDERPRVDSHQLQDARLPPIQHICTWTPDPSMRLGSAFLLFTFDPAPMLAHEFERLRFRSSPR